MIASRDLLNLDEDDNRAIANDDVLEIQRNDDTISILNGLDTSFPSPPSTIPNTPCKYSPSRNARVPASIPNPKSANDVQNHRLHSKLELREIGTVSDTPKITQSSIVRS